MTTEFDLTKEDLNAFNLYHHCHSPTARGQYYRGWFLPAAVWFLVCLGLWAVVANSDKHTPMGALLDLSPLFSGVVAHLVIFPFWYRRKVRKIIEGMITEGKNRGLLCRHRVTISPENIERTGDYGTNATKWVAVEKIVLADEHVLIYLNSMAAVVVPRRAFAGSAEFDRFVSAARVYLQRAQP